MTQAAQNLAVAKERLLESIREQQGISSVSERSTHARESIERADSIYRAAADTLLAWEREGWGDAAAITRKAAYLKAIPPRFLAVDSLLRSDVHTFDLITGNRAVESAAWRNLPTYLRTRNEAQRRLLLPQLRLNLLGAAYFTELFLDAQSRACCILRYDNFRVVVNQNATVLGAGEELEINAGIGDFSSAALPDFLIDHRRVAANPEGVAVYHTRVPSKAGTYSIPLEIRFTDQDGKPQVVSKTITYKVLSVK